MHRAYNASAWLVDRHVANGRGQATAISFDGSQLTYADLLREMWRVQHALHSLGIRGAERIAMIVNDEPGFPAWFLGALRFGVVAVPLSTMLLPEEAGFIIEDAEASVLVVSDSYVDHAAAIATRAPKLRAVVVLGTADWDSSLPVRRWAEFDDMTEAPVASTSRDSVAFWLYTSGTTGAPKGAMHQHASLEATAATYARTVLEIRPDDRCLSVAKLFFAYGLGNSLTFPFSVGAAAILHPRRPTPEGVVQVLVGERPTLFFATPGFIAALLDADVAPETLASIRLTITAGEALPAGLHRRFTDRFQCPLLDGIGSTEALHMFMSNRVGSVRPGTSGTPVHGYEVALLDRDDQVITEPGRPGSLHVKGPSLATGYWRRPDASRAAFRGEWLRTGDVYVRSDDGYYTFLGRNNDMIKAGGIWVSPNEVENVLGEHPDVREAAVVGARNADGLETTVAFVVPRSGHSIDPASIDAHCRARMAPFKRPRRIITTDELPKTPTGKVRRFALRDQLADNT